MSDPQGVSASTGAEGTPTSQPAETPNSNPYEGLSGVNRRLAEERDEARARAEAAEARLSAMSADPTFDSYGTTGYAPSSVEIPYANAGYDYPATAPDPYVTAMAQQIEQMELRNLRRMARAEFADIAPNPEDVDLLLQRANLMASRSRESRDPEEWVRAAATVERQRLQSFGERQRAAAQVDPNTLPPSGGFIPSETRRATGADYREMDKLDEAMVREQARYGS